MTDKFPHQQKTTAVSGLSRMIQQANADSWRARIHQQLIAEDWEWDGHDCYVKREPPDIRTPIRTFSPSGWCEECSVRKYKEKYLLTWNLPLCPLRRENVIGRTDT